jgi:threonine synthase
MRYYSTRGGAGSFSAAEAIKLGLAPDGGLFVPAAAPAPLALDGLPGASYREIAAAVLQPFLPDFSPAEIEGAAFSAYSAARFDNPSVTPLHRLDDGLFFLELWHGPTCAFKDIALQLLPHLLRGAMKKTGERSDIVILAATSGDTGKAALEGFRDVPGTRILVFYPEQGVSEMQKRQMVTQEGANVGVAAVRGDFDDVQAGVKEIFNDGALARVLAERGFKFSSANSINWGRLIPQVVYYFSAYLELRRGGAVRPFEKVNFVVPTGNFGNILAGYYARRMGLPVQRLICASNANRVLTDFINTGIYDRNRPLVQTTSPSMDILISSNLERLLFEVTGHDAARVRSWMEQLRDRGRYRVDPATARAVGELFWADCAGDDKAGRAIRGTYREHGYLIDPHTAVGRVVYEKYRAATGDRTKTVIVSTASPFKFNASVARALLDGDRPGGQDEFTLLRLLSEVTGIKIPPALDGLAEKPVLHDAVVNREQMKQKVLDFLGVK